LLLVALLGVLLSLPAMAEETDSPSNVTNQYLLTAQRLAQLWVQTKPWPAHYAEYLGRTQQEFAPLLSQQALEELRARPAAGPRELVVPDDDPDGGDDAVYQGMIDCVARAHFTVLDESIEGDRATVEVETTVADPFGSGKTESFQDQLLLVRENGRWVLTPQAFKTFAF
jgi:hypothetical protein